MQLDIWLNIARLFGNVAIGACIIICIIIYLLEKNNKPKERNVRFAFFGRDRMKTSLCCLRQYQFSRLNRY